MLRRAVVAVVVAALGITACHRPKNYTTPVLVTRQSVVRKDPTGRAVTLDVEFSYADCPGKQLEVVRGGAEFASCMAKYKLGERITVALDQTWAPEGYWMRVVRRVGDCVREPDPSDDASYSIIRECEDVTENGVKVGFDCRYAPEKKLVEACPWFRRY